MAKGDAAIVEERSLAEERPEAAVTMSGDEETDGSAVFVVVTV